jgi:hypothetical protein
VVAGLGVYAAPPAAALGLAFGLHFGGFIPVTVIGLFFAWKLGISLGDVRESESWVEKAVESAHGPREENRAPAEASD